MKELSRRQVSDGPTGMLGFIFGSVVSGLREWGSLAIGISVAALMVTGLTQSSRAQSFPQLDLSGVADPELKQVLSSSYNLPLLSLLPREAVRALAPENGSLVGIERRRLVLIMQNRGYRAGEVGAFPLDITQEKQLGERGELQADTLAPRSGPLFRIGWISIDGLAEEKDPEIASAIRSELQRVTGLPASALNLERAESRVLWVLKNNAYAFATVKQSKLDNDTDARLTGIVLTVELGRKYEFGDTINLGPGYDIELSKYAPFSAGQQYSESKYAELYTNLQNSNLFQKINISKRADSTRAGAVDVVVKIASAHKKSFAPFEGNLFGLLILASALGSIMISRFAADLSEDTNSTIPWQFRAVGFVLLAASAVMLVRQIMFLL